MTRPSFQDFVIAKLIVSFTTACLTGSEAVKWSQTIALTTTIFYCWCDENKLHYFNANQNKTYKLFFPLRDWDFLSWFVNCSFFCSLFGAIIDFRIYSFLFVIVSIVWAAMSMCKTARNGRQKLSCSSSPSVPWEETWHER